MGATDSKLQFKNHIFRLFEDDEINAEDDYWVKPESASDIFTLLTAADIRTTRDVHIENLEKLLLAVTSRLFHLHASSSFPSESAPAKEMLNCLRLLTRIMPFIFEKKDERMRQWEDRFFWGQSRRRREDGQFEDTPPLAERMIDTGMSLLFYSGFTIPKSRDQVVYTIWETGVGSSTPMTTSHEMQANRIEVLRFLLSLCSDCLYDAPNSVSTHGSRYLTYTVTRRDSRGNMAALCSLLNTTLKYYPGWKVPYEHMIVSDRHRQLVTYSLQLLELFMVYLPPEGKKNTFRSLLSKIYRAQDLQFIADSLAKQLTQPIQASSSYLPGSRPEIEWVCELTMLFWDLIQCNKKFRGYLISSNRIHDFTVILQYYVHDKRQDTKQQGFVRLCAYVLLYLSSDQDYAKSLSKPFEGQQSLPNAIKLPVFSGTYADYLIIQLLKSISTSGDSLDFMVATLLDVVFNISPYVVSISYLASSSFIHLFNTLSAPSFFLANERNQYIVGTLIQTFSLLVNCNFHSNANLVFAMLRNIKQMNALKSTIQGCFDGDDKKGKGKEPEDSEHAAVLSRLSDIWAILDPLMIMLDGVKHGIQFPDDPHHTGAYEPHAMIESIKQLENVPGINLSKHEPSVDEFEPVLFYWNASSLGWYESLLWGNIFQHEHDVGTNASIDAARIVNQNAPVNVGVWNGTDIKLFRLQETAPEGPSFRKPKGAVDALADTVTDTVMQKFGELRSRE